MPGRETWPFALRRLRRRDDPNGRSSPGRPVNSRPTEPRGTSPLAIYMAGRYARREELRAAALELEQLGHRVTSRWLFVDSSVPKGPLEPHGRATDIARMDFEDLRQADLCLAFTEPPDGPQGRGGRHVEVGIALALGLRVVLVGPREHVFHCLPEIETCMSWDEARALLGSPESELGLERELAAA